MTVREEWRWTDERGVQRLVGTEELRTALANNVLAPSTLVWREGMDDWAPASSMPELTAARAGSGEASRERPPAAFLPEKPSRASRHSTLVGLPSPVVAQAAAHPITVPSATEPGERKRPVITQVPRFDGSPAQVTLIPRASRTPALIDEAKPAPIRKPMTSEIDRLWSAAPTEEDETLPRMPRPGQPSSPVLEARRDRDDPSPAPAPAAKPSEAAKNGAPASVRGGHAPAGEREAARPGSTRPPPGAQVKAPVLVARKSPASASRGATPSPGAAAPAATPPAPSATEKAAKTPPPLPAKRGEPEPDASPRPARAETMPGPPPRASAQPAAAPQAARTSRPAAPAPSTTPQPAHTETQPGPAPKLTRPDARPAPPALPARAETQPGPAPIARAEAKQGPPAAAKRVSIPPPRKYVESEAEHLVDLDSDDDDTETLSAEARARISASKPPPAAHAGQGNGAIPRAPTFGAPPLEAAPIARSEPPIARATPSQPPPAAEAAAASTEVSALPSYRPPALHPSQPPAAMPAHTSQPPPSFAMRSEPARLGDPVAVPVSSLYGAGGALICMVIGAFFAGRCSATQPAATAARPSFAAIPVIARAAIPPPPKPCWVSKQPAMWTPRVSKSIPFEVHTTAAGTLAVGYARDAKDARGIEVIPATGAVAERFTQKTGAEIARVVPRSANEFRVVAGDAGPLRSAIPVAASPPFTLGVSAGNVSIVDRDEGSPAALWPLSGEETLDGASVLVAGDKGYALTFRRGGAVWSGWIGPDRKAVGGLVKVVGSGGEVGKQRPASGWNHREIAVIFADRAEGSSRWEIRVGSAPAGTLPSATTVFALPPGGPGGDAFAPDIAGLPDGRWLILWTEGAAGSRAVRAQTLASDFSVLGDPIALSPPAGNYGQGLIGVAGGYAATVFLSKGASSFELWGAILQCGS